MLANVSTAEPHSGTAAYEILVRGALSSDAAADLGARCLDVGPGKTVLVVDVIDQSHLHGILGWLQDRNIAIERVNPL
jgi:hypothetical protein